MNTEHKKENLDDITFELFKEVIAECLNAGLSTFKPLGAAGDDFILHSIEDPTSKVWRNRQLSIRLHNDTVEMLLTNHKGSFMYHGKFNKSFGVEFIAFRFYNTFTELKSYLQ